MILFSSLSVSLSHEIDQIYFENFLNYLKIFYFRNVSFVCFFDNTNDKIQILKNCSSFYITQTSKLNSKLKNKFYF